MQAETVNAIKYKQEICLDQVHRYFEHIDEIFIPEFKIAINFYEQELHVFECHEARYLENKNEFTINPDALVGMSEKSVQHFTKLAQERKLQHEIRFQKNLAIANPTPISLDRKLVEAFIEFRQAKEKVNLAAATLFGINKN